MTQAHWHPARFMAAAVAGWAAIALLFAAQGQAVSLIRGTAQPWWPSLGYSLAIFSIWALLTPGLAAFVAAVERKAWPLPARLFAYLAGAPVTVGLHVLGFALIYWPLYNDGGRIESRWAMAERMFVRNLATDTLLYALLVGLLLVVQARRTHLPPAVQDAAPPTPAPLQIRDKGRLLLVPLAEIEWIGAAGDYAEIHAGGRTLLLERSLAALGRSLPAGEFARIHRGAIVRLDRIAEVRRLGRGDAIVRLTGGRELRLSRRYRANLAALLLPADPA